MPHLTQVDIDACVPRVNRIISTHNRISPSYPLQVLAEEGDVLAISRNELADTLGDQSKYLSLDKLVATCDTRTKKIYIVEEMFPEMVENLRECATEVVAPAGQASLKYEDLTLLNLIFHENVHRSCIAREEGGAIAMFYRDALRDYYKKAATEAELQALSGPGAYMKVQGFNLSISLRNGKWHNSREGLDEFAVTLLTAETLARALGQPGMAPIYQEWRKLFFLHRISDEMVDAFSEALGHITQIEGYDRLMEDYIAGTAARRIYGRFGREGPTQGIIGAVLGLISGEVKAVPLFVEGLYGSKSMAREGDGGRGMGNIIRGIFRR